jgi:hypothetical protein
MAEFSETQIEELLRDYLDTVLEKDEQERVPAEQRSSEREDLGTHVEPMAYMQDDCCRELAVGNHSRATGAVDRLLEEKEIPLDRDGASYNRLCREMMKVMINRLEIEMRRSLRHHSLENLPFPEFSPSASTSKASRAQRTRL